MRRYTPFYGAAIALWAAAAPSAAQPSADPEARQTRQAVVQAASAAAPGLQTSGTMDAVLARVPAERLPALIGRLEGLEREARSPAAIQVLGDAYLKVGNHQKAAELAERLRRQNPDDPKAHMLAAQAYRELGDPRRALAAAEEALRKGGSDPVVRDQAETLLRLVREQSGAAPGSARRPAPAGFRSGGGLAQSGLTQRDVGFIRQVFDRMRNSETGEKVILAVTPNGNIDLDAMRRQGFEIQALPQGKSIHEESVRIDESGGRPKYIISLSRETLNADLNAVAAHLGGRLDSAVLLQNHNWMPQVLLDVNSRLKRVYINLELSAKGFACSVSDTLCNFIGVDRAIWANEQPPAEARSNWNSAMRRTAAAGVGVRQRGQSAAQALSQTSYYMTELPRVDADSRDTFYGRAESEDQAMRQKLQRR